MGVCRDCPNFLEYPLLTREWVKLRASNLVHTFKVSIRTKADLKFWEIRSVGVSRNCPIFECPLLPQERGKLRTSSFIRTFLVSIGRKAH